MFNLCKTNRAKAHKIIILCDHFNVFLKVIKNPNTHTHQSKLTQHRVIKNATFRKKKKHFHFPQSNFKLLIARLYFIFR